MKADVVRPGGSVEALRWIVFVVRGSGSATVGGLERSLVAGDVWVSDAELAVEGSDLHGWLLIVGRDGQPSTSGESLRVVGRVAEPSLGFYRLPPAGGHRCQAFLDALDGELALGAAGDPAAVMALVDLVFVCCSRAFPAIPDVRGEASVGAQRLVTKILDVIDERYADRLSLVDVATELARSPASVARAARLVTGRTVLELITERRIREAHALLSGSELAVGEIAERVGYLNLAHFHRAFRHRTGTTPGRWRADQSMSV